MKIRKLLKGIKYAIEKGDGTPYTVPFGDRVTPIYVYDWPRFSYIVPGDTVLLRFDPAACTLRSRFTGAVSDAPCSFSYEGKTVATVFNGYIVERLKKLARNHAVSVHAYCVAWNPGGYPELQLQMPRL